METMERMQRANLRIKVLIFYSLKTPLTAEAAPIRPILKMETYFKSLLSILTSHVQVENWFRTKHKPWKNYASRNTKHFRRVFGIMCTFSVVWNFSVYYFSLPEIYSSFFSFAFSSSSSVTWIDTDNRVFVLVLPWLCWYNSSVLSLSLIPNSSSFWTVP